MRKAIVISGIVFSIIWLVGCNEVQTEGQVQTEVTEVKESELEVVSTSKKEETDGMLNLFSELENEIILSITEQTELERESLVTMFTGGGSIVVSVGFPKDAKVDNTMIQQIVEDSIKNVSESENVMTGEENITIKIERY